MQPTKKDDYQVKIDLKDAYFTVVIWVNHQKFSWKETLYQFACLSFGLPSAPRVVFTKIMKLVMGLLHQLGIHITV